MSKFFGACLLIAGCSIGAGMLGLPSVTGASGFFPSMFFFFLAWAFMAATGVVLAEVTLSFKKEGISFISMTENTLGIYGKISVWFLFSLLFYAIQVAYFIGGGIFVRDFFEIAFGLPLSLPFASLFLGCVFFILISRGLSLVDSANRYLMLALVLCYVFLLISGIPCIQIERLERANWEGAALCIPMLIICFGFHNLVPSLCSYLDRDEKNIKKVIVFGSLLPLFIYLAWEFVILGVVPFTGQQEWAAAREKGEMITQILQRSSGIDEVVHLARGFAFFAIATSFLPVAFSFFDFLRDALKVKETRKSRSALSLLVLAPPLIVAMVQPDSFLLALEYAGGVIAVLLFGLLPILMAFRRQKEFHFTFAKPITLLFLLITTCVILTMTILHKIGI